MSDLASDVDVLVIGAGPAGLTAATYLGRFLRSVIVADGGAPRASWIPLSHNTPGFPAGITGDAILARMREQAEEYGAVIEPGRVETLIPEGPGFEAWLNGRCLRARAVLLATGVTDRHPDLPGVERAIERALVRICPICDGYEASGKAVARSVYTHLTGRTLQAEVLTSYQVLDQYRRERGYESIRRQAIPVTEPHERFEHPSVQVETGYDTATAMREASRCLDCGVTPVFDGLRCVLATRAATEVLVDDQHGRFGEARIFEHMGLAFGFETELVVFEGPF